MRIPQRVIDEIASRVSLVELVSDYISLERKGGRFWGLCPFHQEKTPSFSVSVDQNVFYCFGCGKGGNLFSFVQEMENLSFPEAVRHLGEKAGVEIPEEESPASNRRSTLTELYSRVAGSFHYILMHSDRARAARSYLDERGVSQEMIARFSLGYAPADKRWLYDFLGKHNYSQEFLDRSGLFSRRYRGLSFFVDRIMFPIRDRRGETVAFGGRSIGANEPKYLNSPDSEIFSKRSTLFGLHEGFAAIRKRRAFFLVEGYLDVIAFHQAGILNAVAPLGTAFTEDQLRLLRRYAERCVLVFDGDDAGVAAAGKGVATCERIGVEVDVALLPEGFDPGDYMRKSDYQSLENVLKNVTKGFTFVVQQALRRNDIRGAGGKESALRYLLPFVDIASSEVRKEAFLDEIADALQVDPRAVRTDYSGRRPAGSEAPAERSGTVSVSHDLYLMLAVAINRSEYGYVRKHVAAKDLQDTKALELYVALEECFREGETSMEALLTRISDEALKALLLERAAREEFAERGVEVIRDSVTRVKERTLGQKRDRVIAEMRKLERAQAGGNEIRSLLEEKMWIDAELQKLKRSSRE